MLYRTTLNPHEAKLWDWFTILSLNSLSHAQK
jgi:hypothetical protein